MPKYKIMIGFVTGNRMVHNCVPVSLIHMLSGKDWSDYEFEVACETGIYVERNRNNVVTKFLKSESDYLYFWDYDNGIFPDAFDIFMETMEDPNVHIVSGLYFRKGWAGKMVAGIMRTEGDDGYVCSPYMFLGGGLTNLSKVPGFFQGMVGSGCLMIRREVLETIPAPWFSTKHYQNKDGSWTFSSEDVGFSELAQEYGYDIYMDTRVRSPHYWQQFVFPGEWEQEGMDVAPTELVREGGEENNYLYVLEKTMKEKED
jgi:hypothetical protein